MNIEQRLEALESRVKELESKVDAATTTQDVKSLILKHEGENTRKFSEMVNQLPLYQKRINLDGKNIAEVTTRY
ncbi:hypothetical protein [Metabacillus litoralis]|uniref:hypothetical protein n=1 Tax=Metabacillus litoralis TaxID=152268 RepID=UPI00203BF99F|nr:hypothetical protein [Metabacillus litoralis]MCM3411260.1 hypothetical protein [Metabacillus litoralis]